MFKALTLSAMVGLAGLTAIPTAQADSLYLGIGGRGPAFGFESGERDWRYHGRDRDWRASCTPERALDKAERIGLRRVSIRDVSRHTIQVSGRDRGERVVVTFGRGPNCPIVRY